MMILLQATPHVQSKWSQDFEQAQLGCNSSTGVFFVVQISSLEGPFRLKWGKCQLKRIHMTASWKASPWDLKRGGGGDHWLSGVEGWKTLSVGHCISRIFDNSRKTIAKPFCFFCSEAIQKLWLRPCARPVASPHMCPSPGPGSDSKCSKNSGSLMSARSKL